MRYSRLLLGRPCFLVWSAHLLGHDVSCGLTDSDILAGDDIDTVSVLTGQSRAEMLDGRDEVSPRASSFYRR